MNNTAKVLDHGSVTLRNISGPTRRTHTISELVSDLGNSERKELRLFDADDTDVANAARMSFNNIDAERSYAVEMKLNKFLMKNHHMTPFECVVVWLEFKLPIFVARQFHRHRTQSISEESGRYVMLPAEWYVPSLETVVLQHSDKKQGGFLVDLTKDDQLARAQRYIARLDVDCKRSYASYEASIADGIAMEQARCHLHLNHYTRYMSTVNLRNLMGFLVLRDHDHAQREAREYAKAILGLLEPHLPGLIALYRELMVEVAVPAASPRELEMRAAMQKFVDHCNNGEIRSRDTCAEFNRILGRNV